MTGTLKDLVMLRNGHQLLTIELNCDFAPEYDDLRSKEVSVEIEVKRNKRSLDANGYLWVLCDKIADKIQSTKTEIYQSAIREVGVFTDKIWMCREAVKTFTKVWNDEGIGYMVDELSERDGMVNLRCYYGSSSYNTKQMSRILDHIVREAKELGITTETPEQIRKMVSLWEDKK